MANFRTRLIRLTRIVSEQIDNIDGGRVEMPDKRGREQACADGVDCGNR